MAKLIRKSKTRIKRNPKRPPLKSKDVPTTQGMLWELRGELKSDIKGLESRMDARFIEMDAKFSAMFNAMDGKFNAMDAKFSARFSTMDAKFDKLMSEVHRIGLLVEDQNARNKYVLDGYASLSDRLDKQEIEISEVKKTLESV